MMGVRSGEKPEAIAPMHTAAVRRARRAALLWCMLMGDGLHYGASPLGRPACRWRRRCGDCTVPLGQLRPGPPCTAGGGGLPGAAPGSSSGGVCRWWADAATELRLLCERRPACAACIARLCACKSMWGMACCSLTVGCLHTHHAWCLQGCPGSAPSKRSPGRLPPGSPPLPWIPALVPCQTSPPHPGPIPGPSGCHGQGAAGSTCSGSTRGCGGCGCRGIPGLGAGERRGGCG